MDDTCAVCAESLEWVAYGSCGHKEVCSTCVARLRFICSDRRCCICKTESTLIFVTKALGDYTKMINDFSVFPSEDKEGRSGSYWYHEDTQAYFDDLDQYKMVKAMCRLSCSVCDKIEENTSNSSKRKARFRDIHQLKGHLFHQHKLFMCSLCLEGRKVFICEQKLYSKAQLKQHINTGDSEVDGTESERGGFQGHPLCEFCRSPFYGDNELYTHMSTEHYTCHICQRQNPGQYEYYKNYDDLEIHFRQEHHLCEDESCLSKKFVVFPSEAEMKRHNALEHGGRMSRAKRNAVLQLPTSFTYRRSNEQNNRHGRRNTFQRDLSEAELSRAIEASLETANNVNGSRFPEASDANRNGFDPLVESFEGLVTESDPRYLMAVSHRPRNGALEESAFPPLSTAGAGPSGTAQKPAAEGGGGGGGRNTMAEKLRRQNKKKVNVLNSAPAWPAPTRFNNNQSASASAVSRPQSNTHGSSVKLAVNQRLPVNVHVQQASSSQPSAVGSSSSSSSSGWKNKSRISHSSSAPNLVSDFPPVSSTLHTPATASVEQHVYAANKSMVEKIREGLGRDEDRYGAFKEISGEYRKGGIDAETYLVYVEQFGLSHLVVDLARLCPDPRKEKELLAVYNANRTLIQKGNKNTTSSSSSGTSTSTSTSTNSKGKGKGKSVAVGNKQLTNSILESVRELQSNYRPPEEEEVEMLSKDGYRANKGKTTIADGDGQLLLLKPPKKSLEEEEEGAGGKQQRKKTSKFHRVRLGNGSMAALLDLNGNNSNHAAEASEDEEASKDTIPVRGVWRNGGGHRLIQKRPS
ncbi:hypothetical protein Lser_V15G41497 [Lactuca serriola]